MKRHFDTSVGARLLAALFCVWLAGASAADWPRFRGANGSGVADTSDLPEKFDPDSNVIWKIPLPPGHSSPILSETRIFLTAFEGEKLITLCINRADGKILWRREKLRNRNEALDKRNNPAAPSAATDGENVYVFFGEYGLISYSADGKERWSALLGPFHNTYGMGASPILVGDKVVLVCDQSLDSFLIAFGKNDGRVRWKTMRPEAVSGHSTPAIWKPEGGPPQIITPGSFQLAAYSPESGKKIWWISGLASEMKSVPVIDGNTIYVSGYNLPENDPDKHMSIPSFEEALAANGGSAGKIAQTAVRDEKLKKYFSFGDLNQDGYIDAREWETYRASMAAENGLLALRAGGQGDMTTKGLRWKYQKSVPQLPSPLLYRGVIYMINDGGILTTLDAETGAVHKQSRVRGAIDHYFASPVAADGKIFLVSQSGVVTVLKAGGEAEVLSVSELGQDCYATPAIADKRIYIRTRDALYCFGKR